MIYSTRINISNSNQTTIIMLIKVNDKLYQPKNTRPPKLSKEAEKYVISEYALIESKESKLPRNERDKIEFIFKYNFRSYDPKI